MSENRPGLIRWIGWHPDAGPFVLWTLIDPRDGRLHRLVDVDDIEHDWMLGKSFGKVIRWATKAGGYVKRIDIVERKNAREKL